MDIQVEGLLSISQGKTCVAWPLAHQSAFFFDIVIMATHSMPFGNTFHSTPIGINICSTVGCDIHEESKPG